LLLAGSEKLGGRNSTEDKMLFIRAAIEDSAISGKGLFTREPVGKGTVVSIHAVDSVVVNEKQYQEEQRKGNELAIRTGIRWVGNHFLYAKEIRPEAFINHSINPTLLYHCGISFARRDLQSGDELTIDYSLFLAEEDVESFSDSSREAPVTGMPAKEALLASTQQLLRLLHEITEIR
jgi:SET domain-containing protein